MTIDSIQIGASNILKAFLGNTLIYQKVVGGYSPLTLFTGGRIGVWYDPSDLTSLWQDYSSTVPVTKSGDPVGLMLDKSQVLALGAELITNADFSDSNVSNYITGSYIAAESGALRVTLLGGGNHFNNQAQILKAGKTYLVSFDLLENNITAGGWSMRVMDGVNQTLALTASSTIGKHQRYFTPVANATLFFREFFGAGNILIDNVSAKEIKGNHARQTLSTARPVSQTDGTKSWLYNDKVDDKLLVTLPAMTATVVTATDDGVTINYPVSILAGNRDITSTSTLGRDYGRIIIDRELTPTEKTQVTTYFNAKRGV